MNPEFTSSDVAVDVLNEVLASNVEQTVKCIGGSVLGTLLVSSVANPVAAVLATLAKVLIKKIYQKTSAIEKKLERINKKLDIILSEPILTAERTLEEILSVQIKTPEEWSECNRRLIEASDALTKAYSYALLNNDNTSLCELIQLYQAFTSAFLIGGYPFVNLYLNKLRSKSGSIRSDASAWLADSEIMALEQQRMNKAISATLGNQPFFPPSHILSGIFATPPGLVPINFEDKENELRTRAKTFIEKADRLDGFCNFVETIAIRRSDILGAMKDH